MCNETHVVHQELDTGTSDSDRTLEGVYGLSVAAEIVGNRRKKTVGRNGGLLANVVEQETTSTVRVLGRARSEALLADQGRRLITETSSNLHALQGSLGKGTVCVCTRRRNNLGQPKLVAIEVEEAQQIVVVLTSVQVHEHGSRGICRVGDEDVLFLSTVEVVDQPGVDGAEAQAILIVGLLYLGDVTQHPNELET